MLSIRAAMGTMSSVRSRVASRLWWPSRNVVSEICIGLSDNALSTTLAQCANQLMLRQQPFGMPEMGRAGRLRAWGVLAGRVERSPSAQERRFIDG